MRGGGGCFPAGCTPPACRRRSGRALAGRDEPALRHHPRCGSRHPHAVQAGQGAPSGVRAADGALRSGPGGDARQGPCRDRRWISGRAREGPLDGPQGDAGGTGAPARDRPCRSEEHTSELQSRLHLVCRLLLEKKKKRTEKREWYSTDLSLKQDKKNRLQLRIHYPAQCFLGQAASSQSLTVTCGTSQLVGLLII